VNDDLIQHMLRQAPLTELLSLLAQAQKNDDNETYIQVQAELRRRESLIKTRCE